MEMVTVANLSSFMREVFATAVFTVSKKRKRGISLNRLAREQNSCKEFIFNNYSLKSR